MAALYAGTSPFDQVHVAVDLETTGLDSARDAILEVGAVRFRGDEVLDTYQTLINPGRNIPEFVQRLTHITPQQVRRAPFFSTISAELEDFLGADPIIGHNVRFDVGFLEANGLALINPAYDTWDLASMFMPRSRRYSLQYLSNHFGISHKDAHRALADAMATKSLFVRLLRLAEEQDQGLLGYISNLAQRSSWPLGRALAGLEGARSGPATSVGSTGVGSTGVGSTGVGSTGVGLTGLDLEQLAGRLGSTGRRHTPEHVAGLDEDRISGMLSPGGPFAKTFGGFEHRPEQEEMLGAVTSAIYDGNHLVIEGGTGVGKSVAYLLPAALFAVSKNQRVVVSTNTINLQEQLIAKDLPALTGVLEQSGVLPAGVLRTALLKGRANYLCLRRWNHLARSESPTVEDARILAKTSVWLQETASGDRGEINLAGRDAVSWSHVSAGEQGFCPGLRDGSPCFVRAARERAEQAHIVVVNHALLLSDLTRGGGLIPDYQHLIIDEAHNLEDEATRQFGFELTQDLLDETWEPQARLSNQIRQALAAGDTASAIRREAEQAVTGADTEGPRLKQNWTRLWTAVEQFHVSQKRGGNREQGDQNQLLITPESRRSQAWAELHLAWENLDVAVQQAVGALERLHRFLDSTNLPGASDQPALKMEAANLGEELGALRLWFESILGNPSEGAIHWVSANPSRGEMSLHSAPLDISGTLDELLFQRKDCVVMTSATLSAEGGFEYFKSRVGVGPEASEKLVGSPFDYQRAAQLLIPEDMPAPNSDRYVESITRVLSDLGQRLGGHTLALFTSYSALRAVAQRLREPLLAHGVQVLAQGTDGSAPQLMTAFAEEPNSVLLGTSSFWEGVDLPTGLLKALVLTRLPFQVPTDPVVKARSGQYSDPFNEYSIPNAVLRFRQGMGRLIRNKEDKGTIVVLDQRISGRGYGKSFLRSIPPCTMTPCTTASVGALADMWIGGSRGTGR